MPDPKQPTSGDRDDGGLTARIGRATGRLALRPVRAVAQVGRGALTDEAERALDGVMAGPLPEAVGRSLVEHRVVERFATEVLEARAAEAATSTRCGRSRAGGAARARSAREPGVGADAGRRDPQPADDRARRRDHPEPGIQARAHERDDQSGGSPRLRAADGRPGRRCCGRLEAARPPGRRLRRDKGSRLAAATAGRCLPGPVRRCRDAGGCVGHGRDHRDLRLRGRRGADRSCRLAVRRPAADVAGRRARRSGLGARGRRLLRRGSGAPSARRRG